MSSMFLQKSTVNDIVTDWSSVMLLPEFLFPRFLAFLPANSSTCFSSQRIATYNYILACCYSYYTLTDEDLLSLPSNDKHSRGSIAEIDDTLPPLTARPRVGGRMGRKMLIATHSDAADSAVSMVRELCVAENLKVIAL